jgi:hypothetical protein
MRAGLTNAQATIQTLLLIFVSFIAVWLSVYRVPWQVSGGPCPACRSGYGGHCHLLVDNALAGIVGIEL